MVKLRERSTRAARREIGKLRSWHKVYGRQPKWPGPQSSSAGDELIIRYGLAFLRRFPVLRLNNGLIRIHLFESEFESPIGIGVFFREKRDQKPKDTCTGMIKLGFEKDTVIVEAMQGMPNSIRQIDKINRFLQQPWANFIISVIEKHAKKKGYKQVKIRKAETLHYFQKPYIKNKHSLSTIKYQVAVNRVQAQMKKRYHETALTLGYREEKYYYVKDLLRTARWGDIFRKRPAQSG